MTLAELIEQASAQLMQAGVVFGHGTTNALDEAAWLVLWQLGLALDTPIWDAQGHLESAGKQAVSPVQQAQVATLLRARMTTRKPAAYLTHEAWLQGVAFYVDERSIVPRSCIAELLMGRALDPWLPEEPASVLDLCTGNGSLAVLAALAYPQARVQASDVSADALAVARINLDKHGLQERVQLLQSDGLQSVAGRFDLIVCNPPYVNAHSMAQLPPEYRAEPALALDGNLRGGSDGMDLIRLLLHGMAEHLHAHGVLVLEIGHERAYFEAAFPSLSPVWLATAAGDDLVLLLTAQDLSNQGQSAL